MYIASLGLENWMRYRGTHGLTLGPKAYAVFAQGEDDPERSNWNGKSSLFEAIDFAITGRLNKDRGGGVDGWITRGQKRGGVTLALSDGHYIERERVGGKTTLRFGYRGGVIAKDEDAQLEILKHIGIDAEEFLTLSYFRQRQMAQFILAQPGPRTDIVVGWMRLGKLEAAADRCAERIRKLVDAIAVQDRIIAESQNTEKFYLQGAELEEIRKNLPVLERFVTAAGRDYQLLVDKLEANNQIILGKQCVAEYEQIVLDGTKLRAQANTYDEKALRKVSAKAEELAMRLGAELSQAERDLAQKSRLALGKFDGVCPVAGIDCPAKASINKDREQGAKLAEAAELVVVGAKAAYQTADVTMKSQRQKLAELDRLEAQIEQLGARMKRIHPQYAAAQNGPEPEDHVALTAALTRAAQRHSEAKEKCAGVVRTLTLLDQGRVVVKAAEERVQQIREELRTLQEASVILGRQGAQRRIAEAALGAIEQGANERLGDCGITLSVGLQWSREGSGQAKACDACGAPFPATAKQKVCSGCGAPRGANIVNKLEVVLSDRSGAAEDLVGASVQLSASDWLRAERGSSWGVLLLDEPFGQLDAANRRAFAGHLTKLLAGRGVEQSFVVAHHASVLDALPGRIEIIGHADHSSVRVVA